MSDYLTVSCLLPATEEERLAQALERWPVLGCQVEDAGDEVNVTVFLDHRRGADVATVLDGLRALGAVNLDSGRFAEQDWLTGYREGVTARPIGSRFWVDPHPQAPTPAPDGRIHLLVEPRQAFGSGSHESTQLVLLMLEELEIAGRDVLDVGTGSGILAIAAGQLGAGWVAGFDIDLEAMFVAHQTVAGQPRPSQVALLAGPLGALRAEPRFEVILANLLPAQVQPLLAGLRLLLAPGGRLLLSGLMVDQKAAVEADLAAAGFTVVGGRTLGEWAGLVCRRSGNRGPGTGDRMSGDRGPGTGDRKTKKKIVLQ
jgi:ribosomal protein L11 methyltransferase